MALGARCSGAILGLYSSSVIVALSCRLKDHRQQAGHEIGARPGIHRHEDLLVRDHQFHQSSLSHDDLPCLRQHRFAEGYRGRHRQGRVARRLRR